MDRLLAMQTFVRVVEAGGFSIVARELNMTQSAVSKQASKTSQDFVKKTAIGNSFEIESSKVALDKSNSDSVKKFAQHMIDDHSKAGENFKTAVSNSRVDVATIPAELDAKHQALLDKLNSESGAQFDKDYIKAQKDAHKETVALFQSYAAKGDDASLKTFAKNTLPTLEEHKKETASLTAGTDKSAASAVRQESR